jgi:hypothetical protein
MKSTQRCQTLTCDFPLRSRLPASVRIPTQRKGVKHLCNYLGPRVRICQEVGLRALQENLSELGVQECNWRGWCRLGGGALVEMCYHKALSRGGSARVGECRSVVHVAWGEER